MIYPTQRAVYLVGAAAPVALAVGVLAPGAWHLAAGWVAAILILLLVDALLVPSLRGDLDIHLPGAVHVGEQFDLAPRLLHNGKPVEAEFAAESSPLLEPVGRTGFRAARRGNGGILRLWARRRGPLGLAWKQTQRTLNRGVPSIPDIRPTRDRGMKQFLRSTAFGERLRTESGDGSEFQALTDFQPGMERRAIDWKASARHQGLLAREYRSERDNSIVFAIDSGRAMCEPVDGVPRVDRAVSAALLAAFVALKAGDRIRLFSFAEKPHADSGTLIGTRNFARLHAAAAGIDYSASETNYTLSLVTLDQRLERRSLVLLFTEFTDPTAAELLLAAAGRMLKRHRILFVVLHDAELETLASLHPATPDDVVRANVATTLLRERRIVIERLRRMGVEVIEAAPNELALTLAERYMTLKERW